MEWISSMPGAVRMSARFLAGCAALLMGAAGILADSSGMLRRTTPPACYCGCSQSHASAGCVKICDSRRSGSRWSAATCAKSRIKTPAENPGAGPRFPRSDRAERASRIPQLRSVLSELRAANRLVPKEVVPKIPGSRIRRGCEATPRCVSFDRVCLATEKNELREPLR